MTTTPSPSSTDDAYDFLTNWNPQLPNGTTTISKELLVIALWAFVDIQKRGQVAPPQLMPSENASWVLILIRTLIKPLRCLAAFAAMIRSAEAIFEKALGPETGAKS
jgi:hypothetical protein